MAVKYRSSSSGAFSKKLKYITVNYQLYLLLLPVIVFFIVFKYIPMYGVQIAFRDYTVTGGFTGSEWVGLKHFVRFFNSADCGLIIKNTFLINIYQLAVQFPLPIIFALMLNSLTHQKYKRIVQTVTYAPHFISTVVLCGMIMLFLNEWSGLFNLALKALGMESQFFMGDPSLFKSIVVWSGVWQGTGWGTIVYLAALSNVSVDIHESAIIDGASKLQRIFYIDLPCILPTIVILLILNSGSLMSVGFEKIFLLMNDVNRKGAEVISTFVYKTGIINSSYSYSAAVGLFNSVVDAVLLVTVNKISKKVSEVSLW